MNEYELLNILPLLKLRPYALESAEPSTPIKDVPPADMSRSNEYSINNGTGAPVVLVKIPGVRPR